MKIPDKAFSQTVAILGRTGSGKSYAARGQIEALLDRGERVCIIDPTGIHWGLKSMADGKTAGYAVAIFGGLHADMEITEASAAPLAKIVATENLPTIVDVSEMGIGERTRFMTHFLEALFRENRRSLTFVVDEADLFAPQRPMPDQTVMFNRMEQIARRGRVRGFRPWLITQRPAELHKSVLSQASTLIAMRMTAPQDRDAMGAWIEGQGDRAAGKAILAELPKLPPGVGYLWAPSLDFLERVAFPQIKTFDSMRTPEPGETLIEATTLSRVDLSGLVDALKPAEPPTPKGKGTATRDELLAEYARGREEGFAAGYEDGLRQGVADVAVRFDLIRGDLFAASSRAAPASAVVAEAEVLAATSDVVTRAQSSQATRVAEGITRPQQHLIDVLARLHALGIKAPEKVTLAVHAEVSSKSSAYGNNLGALRSAGLLDYPSTGCIALTATGRKVAVAPTRLGSATDLRQAWLRAVSAPQAAILTALIKAYPKAIARDELARLAGASSSSSAYGNNLGALRTMGAIDYPQPGHVHATRLLFPAGLT